MKKKIKYFLMLLKYYLWNTSKQRIFLETKSKKEGKIQLFDNEFYFHNGYAFHETYNEIFNNEIYSFKPINKNPLIIDCGSNMGLSVLYFHKNYPESTIIAFEPDKNVIPFLERNIISQEIKNVQLLKKAVWIEETNLEFFTDNGLGGRIGLQYQNQTPDIIGALRLKDFLNKPVEFLKIDIEGAEYKVLKDCQELLINVNYIFVEYHSFFDEEQHLGEILNILKKSGFRYHLNESFSRSKPFVDDKIICEKYDLAINVFAYKVNLI